MKYNKISDSFTEMNELVLPNDTNPLHNLRGGKLLHWMDIAAAIAAQKHSRSVCVTAAVNNVSFEQPIKIGNVVTLQARVVRTFRTSMEVFVEVWSTNFTTGNKYKCNQAFYTFVSLNDVGRPQEVPQVKPENEEESALHENALIRRQLKLLLAGKTTLKDTPELKEQFNTWMKEAES